MYTYAFLLTLCSLLAIFGSMEESKILLMEQLRAYNNSAVLGDREPHSTVNCAENFIIKESELSDFLDNKEDVDKFEIIQKNSSPKSFHLLRLDRTEEVECSNPDPDKPLYIFLIIFSLIILTLFVPLTLGEVLLGTSLTSPELLWALIIVAVHGLLLAVSTYSLFDSKTIKQKVFHVESLEVNKKDFKLISDLKSQSLEYNFNYLFELFCEAYWDSKVNGSEEAKKTSKTIANRINEKLSIAIDSENEEKSMVRDSLDSKWKMIGKELQ